MNEWLQNITNKYVFYKYVIDITNIQYTILTLHVFWPTSQFNAQKFNGIVNFPPGDLPTNSRVRLATSIKCPPRCLQRNGFYMEVCTKNIKMLYLMYVPQKSCLIAIMHMHIVYTRHVMFLVISSQEFGPTKTSVVAGPTWQPRRTAPKPPNSSPRGGPNPGAETFLCSSCSYFCYLNIQKMG